MSEWFYFEFRGYLFLENTHNRQEYILWDLLVALEYLEEEDFILAWQNFRILYIELLDNPRCE
jgi:hypothetical protein